MEGDYDDNDDDEVERESGIVKEDTGANEDSSSSSSDSESSDDELGAEGVGNGIIRKTTSVDEDSDEYEDEGSAIEIEAEEEAGSDDEEGARIDAALQQVIELDDDDDEDGDRPDTEARGLVKEESISVEELEEIINGSSPSSPNERAIDDTGSDMVSFAFVLLLFFVFVPFNDLLTHIMPRLIFLSYGIPSPGSIRCRGLGIGHRRNDFG